MRAKNIAPVIGAAAVLLSIVSPAASDPTYVEFVANGFMPTFFVGLNDARDAAGYSLENTSTYHNFIYKHDGTVVPVTNKAIINHRGEAQVAAISNTGDTGGYFLNDRTETVSGFVSRRSGTIKPFDGPGENGDTEATAIVGHTVAGLYSDSAGIEHGFIRDVRTGDVTSFDAPGAGTVAGTGTFAAALNKSGDTAGYFVDNANVKPGFVRTAAGTFSTFDVTGAGTGTGQGTQCAGLNVRGTCVGRYIDANGANHGFARESGGDIETFDAPGAGAGTTQGTKFVAINSHGMATGTVVGSDGVSHGFVCGPRGNHVVVFDPTPFEGGAATNTFPRGINDAGEIAGYFKNEGGFTVGFLRLPN